MSAAVCVSFFQILLLGLKAITMYDIPLGTIRIRNVSDAANTNLVAVLQ